MPYFGAKWQGLTRSNRGILPRVIEACARPLRHSSMSLPGGHATSGNRLKSYNFTALANDRQDCLSNSLTRAQSASETAHTLDRFCETALLLSPDNRKLTIDFDRLIFRKTGTTTKFRLNVAKIVVNEVVIF
jgi:hypothetical protein